MANFDFAPAPAAATLSVPISGSCPWLDAITQGTVSPDTGLWVPDPVNAIGICDKPSEIGDPTRVTLRRASVSGNYLIGTTLRLRVVYPIEVEDPDEWVRQQAIIRVFGGTSSERSEMVAVRNLLGDASVKVEAKPLENNLTYVTPSGSSSTLFRVTTPENDAHAWDCDGYEYFVVAVERGIELGSDSHLAILQAKFV